MERLTLSHTTGTYERLTERLGNWAAKEENIRTAIIIGSRARSDHPADEWSDLDVIILARDPELYCRGKDWLEAIGTPWLGFVEPSPDGRAVEHRVLYEGGLDVDFVFSPAAGFHSMIASGLIPLDVADMLRRGTRFLVDKDKLETLIPDLTASTELPARPIQADFVNLVHNFWYHALWTAKHLRRGELWWAKTGCDIHLKHLIQQMLEWHARSTKGEQIDTWLRGRFLEEWADPRAVVALSTTFGHYNQDDLWRALLATMDLFAWLESETAAALGFTYPAEGAAAAASQVYELYEARPLAQLA